MEKKGFSLVELLVVIAIISILSVIGIPNYLKFKEKARYAEAHSYISAIRSAQTAFHLEYNGYHSSLKVIGFSPLGPVRFNVGFGNVGVVPAGGPPVDGTSMTSLRICGGPYGSGTSTECFYNNIAPQITDPLSTVSNTSYALTISFYDVSLVSNNSTLGPTLVALVFGHRALAMPPGGPVAIPPPVPAGGYVGQLMQENTWLIVYPNGNVTKTSKTVSAGGY